MKLTQAIVDIVRALDVPKTLGELTECLGRTPMALQRAISGGYVCRLSTDPIRYARGPRSGEVHRWPRVQSNHSSHRPTT